MVVVELSSDAGGDFRAMRLSLSRVPVVGEGVRVLVTVNGLTTAVWFRIEAVVHNASTDAYPRRDHGLDAWVDGVQMRPSW